MVAGMHAYPDIDLEHYGEKFDRIREIVDACSLPVLIDGDDGYGDAKNVARTVRGFETLGASAMFIEDQKAPKRCGHMAGKEVLPAKQFEAKLRAALATRRSADFFIVARTDSIALNGIADAIDRGKRYRDAGADAVYFEGPTSGRELEKLAEGCQGVPLATSILERGGKTPFLSPKRFAEMGYQMLLYPATLIFQSPRRWRRLWRASRRARRCPGPTPSTWANSRRSWTSSAGKPSRSATRRAADDGAGSTPRRSRWLPLSRRPQRR